MPSQPRSRCCRRFRGSGQDGAKPKLKFPETPLILAGAIGGPFCIFLLTPLRNAITLASQDPDSSALELYGAVFRGGFSNGWTGGTAPLIPSCPQWCVMGPLFHVLSAISGTVIAVFMSSMCETFITFGSQALNAQMAFNLEMELAGSDLRAPLFNKFQPVGPGATWNYVRNIVALSGIRIFSRPCQTFLAKVTGGALPQALQTFLGDFTASMGAALCSAPLNQCFNYAITNPEYIYSNSTSERLGMLVAFLSRSYFSYGPNGEFLGLTGTLLRDMGMRCAYMATLYTLFGCIERSAQALWRRCHAK